MAALTTQQAATGGGVYTTAAAAGGGDTIERSAGGGGWYIPVCLAVEVSTTATVVTLDGVAMPSMTSQKAVFVVPPGGSGQRANITYSQVTGVTVGAFRLGVPGYNSVGS